MHVIKISLLKFYDKLASEILWHVLKTLKKIKEFRKETFSAVYKRMGGGSGMCLRKCLTVHEMETLPLFIPSTQWILFVLWFYALANLKWANDSV